MKCLNFYFLIFIVFSFYCLDSLAIVKGSETLVSVEPFFSFPASDSDNKISSFGWFKNGFSLEDATTTCTFDSVYPVSGNIDLNGGTLYLSQDLIFKNRTTFLGAGVVIGNNHVVNFCSSINELPDQYQEFKDAEILLNFDLVVTGTLAFKGNCKLVGHGFDLDLSDNGYIVVGSNSTVRFSDISLEGVTSKNFILTDDTSGIILENLEWKQSGDYLFEKGSITFLNDVDFMGSYSFIYDSKKTSTIFDYSTWTITQNMCLRVGRKDSCSDIEPLFFQDKTSVLSLNSCEFLVTSSGMNLTRGKIEIDKDVFFEIVGTTTSTGLVLGKKQEGCDFSIDLSSGAALHFKSGQLMYNNYENDGINALSESARIIRYGPSKMFIATDWCFPSMVLKVHSGIPETIIREGVIFSYDKSKLVFGDVEYDFCGHQSGSYNFYLDGDDYIYLSKGTFRTPLIVVGGGNKIYGAGNFGGNIILQDEGSSFNCNLNGLVVGDVILNGGTFALGGDFSLGSDAVFDGAGSIELSNYNFDFSGLDSTWTSTILWKSDGGGITLNSNVNLFGRWNFEDTCVINGNGHTIDVGESGCLIIKEGVNLTLRDLVIRTVSQDDIQLLSDNSSLVLDNVKWVQDTDIVFSKGSLHFLNDVDFIGTYSFIYDSSQTSSIGENSKWKITGGMSIRIGKKVEEDSLEPLCFEYNTSSFVLNECSLCVTGSGMNFKRGKVELHGRVNLDIVGTTTSDGLILGSGNKEDDISIYVGAGSALHFRKGQLVYKNHEPDCIVPLSASSNFIRYGPSKMYIASDWVFPNMILKVDSGNPETVVAEDVIFKYINSHLMLGFAELDYTGSLDYSGAFSLRGSDCLYLSKGVFLAPLSISGVKNKICGSGSLAAPIVLNDSDAELAFYLNGSVSSSIRMNGGKVILYDDLCMTTGVMFDGSGSVNLFGNRFTLGAKDLIWTGTLHWSGGDGGSIDIRSKIDLLSTWTFTEDCSINGHGNIIDLKNIGNIVIEDGATLTFRDVEIRGISKNNIRCLGDNGAIVLDNVAWVQDHIYSFTTGSLDIKNSTRMSGEATFFYNSVKNLTVFEKSSLKLDSGFTFYYDPPNGLKDLLVLKDKTSSLILKNANLHTSLVGLEITKGNLIIKGDCCFCADVENIDEDSVLYGNITLGSGVEAQDCMFRISVGSTLSIAKGELSYNNVLSSSIIMENRLAAIKVLPYVNLHVKQDLDIKSGVLYLSDDAFVKTVEGKKIIGSIFITE